VLVGTSRKRFLQTIAGSGPEDVLEASLASAVVAMAAGVSMVRVHDVKATVQAARIIGEPS
jgi:dihydropteroate synthase